MVDKEQDKADPQEGDYIGHEEQAEEDDLSPWVLGEPEQNEIDLLHAVLAICAPSKTLAKWEKMGHHERWFRNGKLHTNNCQGNNIKVLHRLLPLHPCVAMSLTGNIA